MSYLPENSDLIPDLLTLNVTRHIFHYTHVPCSLMHGHTHLCPLSFRFGTSIPHELMFLIIFINLYNQIFSGKICIWSGIRNTGMSPLSLNTYFTLREFHRIFLNFLHLQISMLDYLWLHSTS